MQTEVLTLDGMPKILQNAEDNIGARPALIYVSFTPNPLATPDNCTPGQPDPQDPTQTRLILMAGTRTCFSVISCPVIRSNSPLLPARAMADYNPC
ncbi:hypothetical protein [Pantanalinema sp. GBBB05]|uniref:hypothetical protein n=1 Tax=Pantanalinema sp. GBBB05 TaxID=2604139 RepID=UPI001D3E1762|nr:hypothetical protein [Pantanalinema sp. GBBB05]